MEYSPRPWEARYEDLAYTIYAADEYDIALVACYPAELEQANARLIAAAPELLEACKALLNVYDRSKDRGSYIDAVLQISDAVSKAEGKDNA